MFPDEGLAPLLEAVEYNTYNFENQFEQPSIYRGPPTPEIEKAWEELWSCTYLPLKDSIIFLLMNDFPQYSWRYRCPCTKATSPQQVIGDIVDAHSSRIRGWCCGAGGSLSSASLSGKIIRHSIFRPIQIGIISISLRCLTYYVEPYSTIHIS
jgi:hypothetical protein